MRPRKYTKTGTVNVSHDIPVHNHHHHSSSHNVSHFMGRMYPANNFRTYSKYKSLFSVLVFKYYRGGGGGSGGGGGGGEVIFRPSP